MATSTLGDDKAKYKEMLIHWLASVVILLILPYIMAFSMNLCRVTINVVKNISNNMAHNTADNSLIAQSGGANFEKTLVFGWLTQTEEDLTDYLQDYKSLIVAIYWH